VNFKKYPIIPDFNPQTKDLNVRNSSILKGKLYFIRIFRPKCESDEG